MNFPWCRALLLTYSDNNNCSRSSDRAALVLGSRANQKAREVLLRACKLLTLWNSRVTDIKREGIHTCLLTRSSTVLSEVQGRQPPLNKANFCWQIRRQTLQIQSRQAKETTAYLKLNPFAPGKPQIQLKATNKVL